jgi:hypothetical protein
MKNNHSNQTPGGNTNPQPNESSIESINQFAFENYARDWATLRKFLPVLQSSDDGIIQIDLFYHTDLTYDVRQVEELVTTFYREKTNIDFYHTVKINRFVYKTQPEQKQFMECNNISELESLIRSSFTGIQRVGVVDIGARFVPYKFNYWQQLVNEGYLEPQYEQRARENKKKQDITSVALIMA